MDPHDILDTVAQAAQVREGSEGVRGILRVIHEAGTLTTRQIATAVRLPLPVVAAVRGELTSRGILERRPNGVTLSDKGREAAALLFGGGTPSIPPADVAPEPGDLPQPLLDRLAAIVAKRPDADVALDQAKATPETLARRIAYLDRNDAIAGRRVLCLGDDDFLSVAIVEWTRWQEAQGRSARPVRLTAVDIDPRIVEGVRAAASSGDPPVQFDAAAYDAREPLPEVLRGAFDVVLTDPPYTPPGAELFLSRAVDAVGASFGARCFLSFGHLDPAAMRHVQSALAEMGWVVVEWLPGFNQYEGGSILANISALAHLVLAPDAAPAIEGRYDGPLYTGDLRPVVRTYRCRQCGAAWKIGQGARWQTVAALKRARCPRCGGDRFIRVAGQRGGPSGARPLDGEA